MMCDNACDRMFEKPHDQMTQKLLLKHHEAAMAEWLRRLTRNQMGSPRTGSNPVGSEYFFQNILRLFPVANVTKV